MELNEVPALLSDQEFPTTSTLLAKTLHDQEVRLADGTETLGEVFARCGAEAFSCPDEAVAAVYAGVSAKAVGRVGYSDRDPTPMGTHGPEQVSF